MILTSVLFALAGQQPAQSPTPLQRVNDAPQFAGVYHPAHGFRPATERPRFGPATIWNAHSLNNYYSYGGANQEFMDLGMIRERHSRPVDRVNGALMTYCTSDDDPNGVSCQFRLYDEAVACYGPPSWPSTTCTYFLSGLPGTTPNLNLACWTVQIDFAGVECELSVDPAQQNRFAWSQTWDVDETGPMLSKPIAYGGHNSFLWFDRTQPNRNAAFQGCFWFGGPPPMQFAVALYGQPEDVFPYSPVLGPGQDMTLALEASSPARTGQSVSLRLLDLTGSGGTAPGMLFASAARAEIDLQARFGIDATLLLDANQLRWRSYSSTGSHTTPHFPPSAQGKSVFVQGVQLANALPTRLTAHALEMIVQ